MLEHIKTSTLADLGSHQFAYRANTVGLQRTQSPLHFTQPWNTWSSQTPMSGCSLWTSVAFNTVIPQKLVHKLTGLRLSTLLCSWIMDFMTNRPQNVRIGTLTSDTIIMNTGSSQGCVLGPALFTPFTRDCVPIHSSNTGVKFVDTIVVGLIADNDETWHRLEVLH